MDPNWGRNDGTLKPATSRYLSQIRTVIEQPQLGGCIGPDLHFGRLSALDSRPKPRIGRHNWTPGRTRQEVARSLRRKRQTRMSYSRMAVSAFAKMNKQKCLQRRHREADLAPIRTTLRGTHVGRIQVHKEGVLGITFIFTL
jgi:hypothetical protein